MVWLLSSHRDDEYNWVVGGAKGEVNNPMTKFLALLEWRAGGQDL